MSIKITREPGIVIKSIINCDGPSHSGPVEMECDGLRLTHGYLSPYDMSRQDFCSLACLAAWVKNPPPPETIQNDYSQGNYD